MWYGLIPIYDYLIVKTTAQSVIWADTDIRLSHTAVIQCIMNKVWAFWQTPYSLDMCCIFPYCTKNEQRLYFLSRSSHTWHHCHRFIRPMVKTTAQSVRKRYEFIGRFEFTDHLASDIKIHSLSYPSRLLAKNSVSSALAVSEKPWDDCCTGYSAVGPSLDVRI